MKKLIIISALFFSKEVNAQLQTVTNAGNTTTNVIRFTGAGLLGTSGSPEMVVGYFPTGIITNDTRTFIGWKGDAASNPTTNGLAGTLLLQGRSNISDIPIDFVTGLGTPSLRMRIAGNGNVSIGDNGASASLTPAARLLIKGAGTTNATSSLLIQNSTGTTGFRVLDNGYTGVGVTAVSTSHSAKFGITSATADPGASVLVLEKAIVTGLIGSLRFGSSNVNANIPYWSGIEGNGTGGTDQMDLRFYTSFGPSQQNQERMRIDQFGRVGIGTAAPTAKLEVAGNVIIGTGITSFPAGYNLYVSGGILTAKIKAALVNGSQWSDYVFAKDYQLKPLAEVETFINANKHLPGIPSAQQLIDVSL